MDVEDSRVSQEEEVEHRVGLAEIDQRPTEHPATQGQQAEPSRDQSHISEQRSTAALRHLETDDRCQKDCGIRPDDTYRSVRLPLKLWSKQAF